jgi:flagellin
LVEVTDNASGDGAIAIVDNVLTVTATDATDWDANDTIGITVNGQSVNITLADNDGYDDSVSGVASQIKAAVEAQGISGVSITQSAGVLTFNAGAAVEVPVITTSTTASNSTAVIKAHTGDAVIFSGDWNAGDVFTMDINGSTVSITASASDAYADSMEGLAAQLADEITAAVATSGKGDLGGNESDDFNQGLSAVASGASVDLTQALIISNASMETAGTVTNSGDAIVELASVTSGSDTFGLTVNGEDFSVEISGGAATAGYATTVAGAAAYMATTINASGDQVGVTAVASAGEVTITKNLTIDNLTSTSSSAPVIAASGSEGVYVVSGTGFANGDELSMTIDGQEVSITVANDGYANTATGIANQLAQAVRDADIQGVTVTDADVNDAKFAVTKVGSLDVTSTSAAQLSVEYIDAAIQTLNSQRAELGAISNRLDSTVSNLTNISSNLQAGRGRIEDADFAAETTSLAKSQILQQASTAMLAQANASKQNVLSLLQG